MSDLIVREKCEHGKHDEHTLVDHWTPTVIDPSTDVCPGGKEYVLRREDICARTGDRWPCWSGCEESNRITNYTEVDE